MKNLTIYNHPYPTLNQVSTQSHFFSPPLGYESWDRFENDMIKLMVMNRGIGLAANQIGCTERFFSIGYQSFDEFKIPAIIYNARITKASDELEIGEEGCLSFPGVIYNVYRPIEIEAEWQNNRGETTGAVLKGLEARCFQHELDHLNGITFNLRAEENNL